jgi:DNA-binding CsgD family transcriptional regulator
MPRVGQIPDYGFAENSMRVAESRSLDALGVACGRAIGQFTGSSCVGLYWLNGEVPALLYSDGVANGFHDDYETGLGKSDPFIDSILHDGRVVDGLSLIGSRHWSRSTTYDLLRTWGFSHDMCGPLRLEDKIAGVFYTATPAYSAPYTAEQRRRMALLCRAASLALSTLVTAGVLDERTGPTGRALPAPGLDPSAFAALPPRAAEVARLVCRGRSNKEIARDMGISDQTVKDHVASLCRRFGALNRTDLAARLQGGMPRQ